MYRVFRLPPTKAEKAALLLADDLVGRQSVTTREAKSLGLPGDDRYVIVEGIEAALARAVDLMKGAAEPLGPAEAEKIYGRFRLQDDEAASGMGLIFGP